MQELMWDHYHMTRGIIRILVTRLRTMMTAQGAQPVAGAPADGGHL